MTGAGLASLPKRIAATLFLLVFAGFALASGLDRMSLQAPGLARHVPPPFRAEAARSEARSAIVREQPELALAKARQAVAADPLHPASTALLGTAYLLNGDATGAEAAFRVAARFGWRDPATQLYWYEAALQAGDLPRAVDRADAILRAQPRYSGLAAMLAPLENTPEGREALVRRMAGRPDWLKYYLQPDEKLSDETFDRRSMVLVELAAAGTSLGCDKVTPFVQSALQRGARRQAESVWTGHCPGASFSGGLADGGFERFGKEDGSPFGWTTQPSGDVALEVVETGSGNRVLRMRNRSSVSRLVLKQPLALEPGTYRLSGMVQPGQVAASLGCGKAPEIPGGVVGDIGSGGQMLYVPECSRLELGLWLRPGGEDVQLGELSLKKAG